MANYRGFELKSMKSWTGMEGIGTQASVYFKGKRLGTWTDDGNGGCGRYDFDITRFKDAIAEQCADLVADWDTYGGAFSFEADMDTLMCHLADMTETEKVYRKWWRSHKDSTMVTGLCNGKTVACFVPKDCTDGQARLLFARGTRGKRIDKESIKIWHELPVMTEGEVLAV